MKEGGKLESLEARVQIIEMLIAQSEQLVEKKTGEARGKLAEITKI